MSDPAEITQLEEQLAEVRARRFMAERDAEAVSRHSGLSKEPRKLDKDHARAESHVEKLRGKEAKLQERIQLLRTPVEEIAPSETEPDTPQEEVPAEEPDSQQ